MGLKINVISDEYLTSEELNLPFSDEEEQVKPRPFLLLGASSTPGKNLFVPKSTNDFGQRVQGVYVSSFDIVNEEIQVSFDRSNADAFIGRVKTGTSTTPPYTFTVAVEEDTEYTFSITESTGLVKKNYVQFYDSTGKIVKYNSADVTNFSTKVTFITPVKTKYIGLRFGGISLSQGVVYRIKGKLELGGTATDWTPYNESSEDSFGGLSGEIIHLLRCMNREADIDLDDKPNSRIGEMLYDSLTGATYSGSMISRLEKLFAVFLGFADNSIIDFNPLSRSEAILYSKIFGTTYSDTAKSEAERLLLELDGSAPVPPAQDSNIVGTAKADYAVLTA